MPERAVLDDELGAARERFADWATPVQQVLAATAPEAAPNALALPRANRTM